MKTYQIKTYNLNGTYKDTINPNDILNEISFSSNINGWAGQLNIQTSYKLEDLNYQGGEYVKVTLFDDAHKSWIQIYYWYISQIIRSVESSREYTTFVCLWIQSLLNNILYTNGSYTKTPSAMVTDVLNFFRNYYTSITAWSINTSDTWNQNYNRQYQNCFNIIKSVSEWSWSKFLVDGEWKLNFFKTWTNHLLHLHYDIDKMQITDTIEEIVNNYSLARNGGTVATYSNASSQSTYWRKDKYESNSELNSSTTQDAYWNQYIADNKNPKETMSITLNKNYPFEEIKPWDTITVLNAWITIANKVVNKISYKPDQCVLTIDKTDTLWNVIE